MGLCIPRPIGTRIESSKCIKNFYNICINRDLYNLVVKLFSDPDIINDALVVFDLFVKREFLLRKNAYEKVFKTIKILQTLD